MISRKRFLQCAAVGGAALIGRAALSLNIEEPVSGATPLPQKMLTGSLAQALNVRALTCATAGSTCASPRLLTDGRYALPATALQDSSYAVAAEMLSGWHLNDVGDDELDSQANSEGVAEFTFSTGGNLMRQVGRPSSLTMPSAGVFRFAVEPDDFGGTYDSDSGSRRSEIVARRQDGVGAGTVWSSFCLILGSTPGLSSAGRGIVHQWHSADEDARRTPVLFVDVANSEFTIRTCSSAHLYGKNATGSATPQSGVQVVHYSASAPRAGEKMNITLQATFGKTGHLNGWINGDKVIDADTPIGYYDDLSDGSGRTVLGYPHWGLYTTNQPETDVVYIANPEWGTKDLSSRVNAPLFVPEIN